MDSVIPRHAVVLLGGHDDIAYLRCGHFCLSRAATHCCACAASRSQCRLCRPWPASTGGAAPSPPAPEVKAATAGGFARVATGSTSGGEQQAPADRSYRTR
jgi:hypothetical protein